MNKALIRNLFKTFVMNFNKVGNFTPHKFLAMAINALFFICIQR